MSITFRRLARASRIVPHLLLGVMLVHLSIAPCVRRRGIADDHWRLVRWWIQRLLAILRIHIESDGQPSPSPVLLIANHVSWLDIPCLLAATDTVFVAKAEVARWPVLGLLATGCGTIFISRGRGSAQTLREMCAALTAGQRVLVFPEGTSTDGSDVKQFHARLFEAASIAGVPVQPIAIHYPHKDRRHPRVPFVREDLFLPHLWKILGIPEIAARIHFGPLMPSGLTRRELANQSRKWVRDQFGWIQGLHDPGSQPQTAPLNTSA